MLLPTDFFFEYENYVSLTPGPEIMQVRRQAGGRPHLHYHSWLGTEQQRTLELDAEDFAALAHMVLHELPFWELPTDIRGDEPLYDGDWPHFTLRYQGREHTSTGPCAGYWHPGIAQLQAAMTRLYEKYLLEKVLLPR